LHFLHGEINYPSLDALKQGIAQDVVDLLDWREQQAFAKSCP
jgi:riboflavin kinase/FMN adenylyltransferase